MGGITGQFYRQFALTISASMIISAVNAMTMTPARAASIFAGRKAGQHGDHGEERCRGGALPSSAGSRPSDSCRRRSASGWAWLPGRRGRGGARRPGWLRCCSGGSSSSSSSLGAVAESGALGWFLIRPVNWALGYFFRGFNWSFDRATEVSGKFVGWALRLAKIVLLAYVGLLGLTGFGFTRIPAGFIPQPGQGSPDRHRPVARLGRDGAAR